MQDFGLPGADTPFFDKNTGLMSQPWYTYLANLFAALNTGVVGNTNEVLHGGGAGYSKVSLTADVLGRLTSVNFVTGGLAQVFMGQGTANADYRTLTGDVSVLSSGFVTVSGIGGASISASPTAAGNILIGDGAAFLSRGVIGDASLVSSGVITVTGIRGTTISAVPTSGAILIGNGTTFATRVVIGDASLVSTGLITVTGTGGVSFTSYSTAARGQLLGTGTNDTANAGNIGELQTSFVSSSSPVTSTNATAVNLTSVTISAGDWDVWGNFSLVTVSTAPQVAVGWISTVSAAIPDLSRHAGVSASATNTVLAAGTGFVVPGFTFSVTLNTPVYLSTFCQNGAGHSTVAGNLIARRRR